MKSQNPYPDGPKMESIPHSFGMLMSNRSYSSPVYRYGFNEKENDDEINLQDYGLRAYNLLTNRFLSVDPLFESYPWNSSYAFAENKVIECTDLDGAEKRTRRFGFNVRTVAMINPKNYDLDKITIYSNLTKRGNYTTVTHRISVPPTIIAQGAQIPLLINAGPNPDVITVSDQNNIPIGIVPNAGNALSTTPGAVGPPPAPAPPAPVQIFPPGGVQVSDAASATIPAGTTTITITVTGINGTPSGSGIDVQLVPAATPNETYTRDALYFGKVKLFSFGKVVRNGVGVTPAKTRVGNRFKRVYNRQQK